MTPSDMSVGRETWVLQFCHGYGGPFLDCARQYAVLFKHTPYKVCTVYLTGEPRDEVKQGSASDEVIFLNYSSRQVRGLKLLAIRDLKRIVASRNFSFCIAHRFKPIYVALLASHLPVIGVHHAFGGYQRRSRRWLVTLFRQRLTLLGVSEAVRNDIRQSLKRWPDERIQTFYNRIDIQAVQAEQLSREQARQYLSLPPQAWVVGNAGRLHPDKDQATLIRGFAEILPQLPSGSLLAIMGSGRLEAELATLARELNVSDSVRFLGQVPHGRRYFRAFDLFVLSSDHEPFGMVLLEAMAAGVPVIGTNCGGVPEVLGPDALLFPLGDHTQLAACLRAAAQWREKDLAARRQEMAVRLAQLFSDDVARVDFWSRWSWLNL